MLPTERRVERGHRGRATIPLGKFLAVHRRLPVTHAARTSRRIPRPSGIGRMSPLAKASTTSCGWWSQLHSPFWRTVGRAGQPSTAVTGRMGRAPLFSPPAIPPALSVHSAGCFRKGPLNRARHESRQTSLASKLGRVSCCPLPGGRPTRPIFQTIFGTRAKRLLDAEGDAMLKSFVPSAWIDFWLTANGESRAAFGRG